MATRLLNYNMEALIFRCMYTQEEVDAKGEATIKTEGLHVDGVVTRFILNPERIEQNRVVIDELLNDLPAEFHEKTGGGWTFLNACCDKDGNIWGEQADVEFLICLGQAIGRVAYTLPRVMWGALPGGMPYFVVKDMTNILNGTEHV